MRAGRRVVQPLLGEAVPDPLDDPALDLARGAERVDHAADVVDRRHALDRHLARLDVDGDLHHLHAEREHVHPGRVRAARPGAEDLAAAEQPDDLLERLAAPVRKHDLAARERELLRARVVALGRELEDLPPGVAGGRAHRGPHRRHRRGAGRERRVGAAGGVADRDRHVLERERRAPRPRSAPAPPWCRCRRPGRP